MSNFGAKDDFVKDSTTILNLSFSIVNNYRFLCAGLDSTSPLARPVWLGLVTGSRSRVLARHRSAVLVHFRIAPQCYANNLYGAPGWTRTSDARRPGIYSPLE